MLFSAFIVLIMGNSVAIERLLWHLFFFFFFFCEVKVQLKLWFFHKWMLQTLTYSDLQQNTCSLLSTVNWFLLKSCRYFILLLGFCLREKKELCFTQVIYFFDFKQIIVFAGVKLLEFVLALHLRRSFNTPFMYINIYCLYVYT